MRISSTTTTQTIHLPELKPIEAAEQAFPTAQDKPSTTLDLQDLAAFLMEERHIKGLNLHYEENISFAHFFATTLDNQTEELLLTNTAAARFLAPLYASMHGVRIKRNNSPFEHLEFYLPSKDSSGRFFRLKPLDNGEWGLEKIDSPLLPPPCSIPLKDFLISWKNMPREENKTSLELLEMTAKLIKSHAGEDCILKQLQYYPVEKELISALSKEDACAFYLIQAIGYLHANQEELAVEAAKKIALNEPPRHPLLKQIYEFAKEDAGQLPALIDQLTIQAHLKGIQELNLGNFSLEPADNLETAAKRLAARKFAPECRIDLKVAEEDTSSHPDAKSLLAVSKELSKSSIDWIKKSSLRFLIEAMKMAPKRSLDKTLNALIQQISPLNYPYEELLALETTLISLFHDQKYKTDLIQHVTLLKLQRDCQASYGLNAASPIFYENAFKGWENKEVKDSETAKLLLEKITNPACWIKLLSYLPKADNSYVEKQIRSLDRKRLSALSSHLSAESSHLNIFLQALISHNLHKEAETLLSSALHNDPRPLAIARIALTFLSNAYKEKAIDKEEVLKKLTSLFDRFPEITKEPTAFKLREIFLTGDASFLKEHIEAVYLLQTTKEIETFLPALISQKEKDLLDFAVEKAFRLLPEMDKEQGSRLLKTLIKAQRQEWPKESAVWNKASILSPEERKQLYSVHGDLLEPLLLQFSQIYKSQNQPMMLKELFHLWSDVLSPKGKILLCQTFIEGMYHAKDYAEATAAVKPLCEALDSDPKVKIDKTFELALSYLTESIVHLQEGQNKEQNLHALLKLVQNHLRAPYSIKLLKTFFQALQEEPKATEKESEAIELLTQCLIKNLDCIQKEPPPEQIDLIAWLLDTLHKRSKTSTCCELLKKTESLIDLYLTTSIPLLSQKTPNSRQQAYSLLQKALSYLQATLPTFLKTHPPIPVQSQIFTILKTMQGSLIQKTDFKKLEKDLDILFEALKPENGVETPLQAYTFLASIAVLSTASSHFNHHQKNQLLAVLIRILEKALATPSLSKETLCGIFVTFSIQHLQCDTPDTDEYLVPYDALHNQAKERGVLTEHAELLHDIFRSSIHEPLSPDFLTKYPNFWELIDDLFVIFFKEKKELFGVPFAGYQLFVHILSLLSLCPAQFEKCFSRLLDLCHKDFQDATRFKVLNQPLYLYAIGLCMARPEIHDKPQIQSYFKHGFFSIIQSHLQLIEQAKKTNEKLAQELILSGFNLITCLTFLTQEDPKKHLEQIAQLTTLYLEEIFSREAAVFDHKSFVTTIRAITENEICKKRLNTVFASFKARESNLSSNNKPIWHNISKLCI